MELRCVDTDVTYCGRRCVVSVEFNLVSRKTNLVEEQRQLGEETAELTHPPPQLPTHTHTWASSKHWKKLKRVA